MKEKKSIKPLALIAEADHEKYQIIHYLLEEDFKLIRVTDGFAATLFCDETEPDIVLMSIPLPKLGGFEAFTLIHEKNPSIPVVALADPTTGDDLEQIKNHGFDGYISKPINAATFVSTVTSYLYAGKYRRNAGKDGRLGLLIVEDEALHHQLDDIFLRETFELFHAWNGREAVEMAEIHHPDIILMDLHLPEMDGREAAQMILKQHPQMAVIALSAYTYKDDHDKLLKMGFDGSFMKPVQGSRLPGILLDVYQKKAEKQP